MKYMAKKKRKPVDHRTYSFYRGDVGMNPAPER